MKQLSAEHRQRALQAMQSGLLPAHRQRDRNGWSTADYMKAAAVASGIANMAPFFWCPPLWVLALLQAPSRPPRKPADHPSRR